MDVDEWGRDWSRRTHHEILLLRLWKARAVKVPRTRRFVPAVVVECVVVVLDGSELAFLEVFDVIWRIAWRGAGGVVAHERMRTLVRGME